MECNQCCLLFFTSTTGSLGVHCHCYYGLLHWSGDLTLRIRNAARASLRIFNLCGPKIRTHKINSSPGRTEPSRAEAEAEAEWQAESMEIKPMPMVATAVAARLSCSNVNCNALCSRHCRRLRLPFAASSCCSCLSMHACKTRTAAAGCCARVKRRGGGNNIFSHCGFCTVRKIYCMAH